MYRTDLPTVLDVFSGCGGLSAGFSSQGFSVVAGIDSWGDALDTFALNHPGADVREADLGNPDAYELFKEYEGVDAIVGGPPCQGFSIAGKRDPLDPRNRLYEGFLAAVRIAEPQVFIMENVPNLLSMSSGELLDAMAADFAALGYELNWSVLTASDFGVPQKRRRFFLVGTRWSPKFEFPIGDESVVTAREALSDLPAESLPDRSPYPVQPLSEYQRSMRHGSTEVWNHEITKHTDKTKSIIALVPDGGNYKDLPVELQDTRRVNIAWTRLSSSRPSFTIDTGHRHHFHYEFDRVPTVRESARIQSFPDTFRFLGSKTSQLRQVGNAVPPGLASRLAAQMKLHLS